MKNKKVFMIYLGALFLFPAMSWAQNKVKTTSSKVSKKESKNPIQIKSSLSFVSTNNELKKTGSNGTEYIQAEVSAEKLIPLSKKFFIIGSADISGELNQATSRNKNSQLLRVETLYYLTKKWDLGTLFSYSRNDSFESFYASTPSEFDYMDQVSHQFNARVFGKRYLGKWKLTLGSNFVQNNFENETTDGLIFQSGNVRSFKDNNFYSSVDLKVERYISKRLQLESNSELGYKKYSDRSSEFSDGRISFEQNNFDAVETVNFKQSLQAKYKVLNMKLKTSAQYLNENDQVFGARNANSYGINNEIKVPIVKALGFKNNINWLQKNYQKHIADPYNYSDESLRVDKYLTVSNGLDYRVKKGLTLNLDYIYSHSSSNYISADLYDEHLVKTGMGYKF